MGLEVLHNLSECTVYCKAWASAGVGVCWQFKHGHKKHCVQTAGQSAQLNAGHKLERKGSKQSALHSKKQQVRQQLGVHEHHECERLYRICRQSS